MNTRRQRALYCTVFWRVRLSCALVFAEQRAEGVARRGGVSERLEVEGRGLVCRHEARVRRRGLAVRARRQPTHAVRVGAADGAHAPPQASRARARASRAERHGAHSALTVASCSTVQYYLRACCVESRLRILQVNCCVMCCGVVAAAIAGVAEGGLGVRDVVHVEISRRGEEVGLRAPPPLGALHQAARAAGALVALLPSHARGAVLCSTVLYTLHCTTLIFACSFCKFGIRPFGSNLSSLFFYSLLFTG